MYNVLLVKTMKNNRNVASTLFDSILLFLQFDYLSTVKLRVLITSNDLRISNLNSLMH